MKTCLIVTAGGSGTRMGGGTPKQFLRIGGKAILHITLDRLAGALPDAEIVTVLPKDSIDGWKEYCYEMHCDFRQTLVAGGITRFHSIKNALEKVPDGVLVGVHDGVRPIAGEEFLRRLRQEALACGSAVPVTPLVETLKTLDPKTLQRSGESPDRSRLFGVQTPQFFLSDTLKAAYRQPFNTMFTDDSSVVEALGQEVHYCPGERFNIKITTPDDLVLAETLLQLNRER